MRDVFLTAQEHSLPLWGQGADLLSHVPARDIAGGQQGQLWDTRHSSVLEGI